MTAYSPLGCHATSCDRLAAGTTKRSWTMARSASMTVTSDIDGVRSGTNRERAWVTKMYLPSGDWASDHGERLALRPLDFLERRHVDDRNAVNRGVQHIEIFALLVHQHAVRFVADLERGHDFARRDVHHGHIVVEPVGDKGPLAVGREAVTSLGCPPTGMSAIFFRPAMSTTTDRRATLRTSPKAPCHRA